MKQIYYVPLHTNSREKLINMCIEALKLGKEFIYILPSREAMFDVRNKLISSYGGLVGLSKIFSIDDLEKLIVQDSLYNKTFIDADAALILIKNLCLSLKAAGKLKFFEKVAGSDGFIEEIYKVIKSLRRQNISQLYFKENTDKLCQKNNDINFSEKCEDILEIFKGYLKELSDKNIYDIDDISYDAVQKIKESRLFDNVQLVIVDGYINIDPINKVLFEEILKSNQNFNFIFNIPFLNTNNTKFLNQELLKWLESLNFEYTDYSSMEQIPVSDDIKALSYNLFSQKSKIINHSESIKIYNSPCIENEVRQTARIIKNKLITNNTTPENIAVYINNLEDYQEPIKDIFKEFGIPVNSPCSQNILSQPLIRDIFDILKIGVAYSDVDKLNNILHSKYLIDQRELKERDIKPEILGEISSSINEKGCVIENVKKVIEENKWEDLNYGIREVIFLRDFLNQISYIKAIKPQSDILDYFACIKETLQRLEIKRNIISMFKVKIIDSEVFLRDIKVLINFENYLDSFTNSYNACGLEQTNVSYEEFLMLLEDYLSGKTVLITQANSSGVKIINTDLARGQLYDYVFMLGVNEGIYPKIKDNILFDTYQSKLLFERGINLNNQKYELEREKIRFNLACSTAQKGLYISYRTSDEENGYMIKSALLEELEGLFTSEALNSVTCSKLYMRDRFVYDSKNILTVDEAKKFILDSIWQNEGQGIDNLKPYSQIIDTDYKDNFRYIIDAGKVEFSRNLTPEFDKYDGRLDKPTLKQSSSDYTFSASQINNYIKCPFGYFLGRVLEMESFEEDEELTAVNEGRIYHKVLKDYYENNKNITQFDQSRLNICIENTFNIINNTKLAKAVYEARKREIQALISSFLRDDIYYLEEYQKQSGKRLVPVFLESAFEDGLSFANSKFKGVIDRVDLELDDNDNPTGKFIIYDYKRSSASSLADCVKGQDLQLAIYYYCLIHKLKSQYKMESPECIGLLYYSIEKASRDGIIRKEYKKQMGLTAKRNVISGEKFFIVLEHLKKWVEKIVLRIQNGDFTVPYECDPQYCDYASICRYDKYRVASKKVKA